MKNLMIWMVFLLVISYSKGENFTLGYVTSMTYTAMYPAAINIALDEFRQRGLLTEHNFSVVFRGGGSCAVPKTAIQNGLQLYLADNVDVLFGPACSSLCIPLSYSYDMWNVPIFPDSSASVVLGDKDVHRGVIRTYPPYNKMGEVFVQIMKQFGWDRIVLLYSESNIPCNLGAAAINTDLLANNITVAERIGHTYTDGTMPTYVIDQYLLRIKQRARVAVICNHELDMVNFMLRTPEHGMDGGDFVFLWYRQFVPSTSYYYTPWIYQQPDLPAEEIQRRRRIFHNYKQVTLASFLGDGFDSFTSDVKVKMSQPPYNNNYTLVNNVTLSTFSAYLHDAAHLYFDILSEILQEGLDPRDMNNFMEKAKFRETTGLTGHITMDEKGDREPDYWMWYVGPDETEMTPWMTINTVKPPAERVTLIGPDVYWGTADNTPPVAVPLCGFFDENCPQDNSKRNSIIGSVVGVVAVIALVALISLYFYRRRKSEEELQAMYWKVTFGDIQMHKNGRRNTSRSFGTLVSLATSVASGGSTIQAHHTQLFTTVGTYKGHPVAIRQFPNTNLVLSRKDLIHLKCMRELSHENVNQFIGACVDPPQICVLSNYCAKGSLQDILENQDINLDWMFKYSLISDLTNGMCYLHRSDLGSHGNLKSSSCLIDSRWVLKITSYGLHMFKNCSGLDKELTEDQKYKKMIWTSPELLRMGTMMPPSGSQQGDVYSFAIIVQEIMYRALPYFMENMSPKEIVQMVKDNSKEPYRPCLPDDDHHDDGTRDVISLMKECWDENHESRPTFPDIQKKLRKMNRGTKFNIVDNMIKKLEKYASNLEDIVEQRTSELMTEKRRADMLLHRMLPQSVAERLKAGVTIEPEMFDEVSIYFSDIVGFTAISSESSPIQVIDLLNDLYTIFDDIIERHDVYKVETIGDAYMVVSGLPKRIGRRHVSEIANMALDLLSAVYTDFTIRHKPGLKLKLRIGLHSGPCAAGVVGIAMPRYCLFGDTVNVASRMESNGLPFHIHISEMAHRALIDQTDAYKIKLRGEMPIKGKGMLKTYWLYGREDYNKQIPNIQEEI